MWTRRIFLTPPRNKQFLDAEVLIIFVYLKAWYPEPSVQSSDPFCLWNFLVCIKCSTIHCIFVLNLYKRRQMFYVPDPFILVSLPEVWFWWVSEDRGNIWRWRKTSWRGERTSSCRASPTRWLWGCGPIWFEAQSLIPPWSLGSR